MTNELKIKCFILLFETAGETDASKIPPKYEVGERVLCFHGPLIYEGKPLKIEFRDQANQFAYLIHSAGWNKRYEKVIARQKGQGK
jgi:hypothetical protein